MAEINPISIAGYSVGPESPPFIIAEMSGNHNQSYERAMAIVEAAAAAGAHAIKLQTYTADTMTLDLAHGEFFIDDPNSLWKGNSLYSLYQKAYTPWEWHRPLFERAKELGLIAFSTPFDFSAVDFLEELNVPAYKIASFENTDLRLIARVAQTGKPLIISTGMASLEEINEAVDTAKNNGCSDLILLKCTSSYPAPPHTIHLRTLPMLKERYGVQIGLSDHTLGNATAIAATALGATVIEKHFTLSRAEGGVDAAFSMEPEDLKNLVTDTKAAWEALGSQEYVLSEEETSSKVFRRTLYVCEDISAGTVLSESHVRAIRPGKGLPPKYWSTVIGKKLTQDVSRGTPLSWELLDVTQPVESY